MSISEQILNESFNMYYKKGIDSYRNGSYDAARKNILLAAEALLKLAKLSSGELKTARINRADKLIEIAKEIKENGANANISAGITGLTPKRVKAKEKDDDKKEFHSAKIPNISFKDVAGLEEVKKSIKTRFILPIIKPEIYKKYKKKVGGGMLLYGPPGTGKTMISKAIANEVGAKFYAIKCSDIVSKWFGEAEKNLKELFETARECKRAIIFFDELEALGVARGSDSSVMNRIVPELLTQIQGFDDDNETLLILGATNRPWDIDPALLRSGRFDELVYVGLPDVNARKFIINKAIKDVPIAKDVDIDWLADICKGLSGAEIDEMCDRAKEDPLLRNIATGKDQLVAKVDFVNAREKIRVAVTKQMLLDFEKFRTSG